MLASRPLPLFLVLSSVFLGTFGFFLFLQSASVFPDPDSFYHVKVARELASHGIFDRFPWLAFTSLSERYTDQHFLYHVFLLPFTQADNPLLGAKIATAGLNAALFTLLAWFLISFRVRYWYVFFGILLVTNPFLFRINLVKAPAFSLLLLVAGLWSVFRHRVWPVAVLGFFYVWAYGGFILLPMLAGVYAIVGAAHAWYHRVSVLRVFRRVSPTRLSWSAAWRSPYVHLFIAATGGMVAGVLLSPYFPQNLFFYWQQLVQIGIINFQDVINVGGEWRPYGFIELLANTVFVSIAVLLALVFFVLRNRRQSAESWTLLVLTVFFFLITLKSRRYVELYVPFAVLYAGFALRDAFRGLSTRELGMHLRVVFAHHRVITILVAVYCIAVSAAVITRDTLQLNTDLKRGFSFTTLQRASAWLAEHTPTNSIVVHSDWDEFPILYYHNTENRYIVGLDPTFMYQYDKARYERWATLTSGKRSEDATRIITQDLQSTTVLVTKDHREFLRTMEGQNAFSRVYDDDEAVIFQLRDEALPALSVTPPAGVAEE